jgi:hypothetical protein
MSQGAVEKILGKLVTDDAFRERFFTDPTVASFTAGLELSRAEVEALLRLPKKVLLQFSRRLDDRLRRLPLDRDEGLGSLGGLGTEGDAAAHHTEIGTPQGARTPGVGGGMALPTTLGRVDGSTNARVHPRDAGPTLTGTGPCEGERR